MGEGFGYGKLLKDTCSPPSRPEKLPGAKVVQPWVINSIRLLFVMTQSLVYTVDA